MPDASGQEEKKKTPQEILDMRLTVHCKDEVNRMFEYFKGMYKKEEGVEIVMTVLRKAHEVGYEDGTADAPDCDSCDRIDPDNPPDPPWMV